MQSVTRYSIQLNNVCCLFTFPLDNFECVNLAYYIEKNVTRCIVNLWVKRNAQKAVDEFDAIN